MSFLLRDYPLQGHFPLHTTSGVAPTVTDDATRGHGYGSMWTAPGGHYICVDPIQDSAVWILFHTNTDPVTPSISPLSAAALSWPAPKNNVSEIPPDNNDDDTQGYSAGSIWIRAAVAAYICLDNTTGFAVWVGFAG